MKLVIRRFGFSCQPMLKAASFGKNCSSLYGRWSWIHHAIACHLTPWSRRSTSQGMATEVIAPMPPSALRRSQMWRARSCPFEAQF